MERKIGVVLLIIIISILQLVYSQPPRAIDTKGGIIAGRVIDSESKIPIEYATIALLRQKDSSVYAVTSSNNEGYFVFEKVIPGEYKLKVTFVGYQVFKHDSIKVLVGKPLRLPEISLKPVLSEIDAVVVKGERSMIENKIDRKVFYVDKNVMAQSGTATDVLQQVPSVQVDAEGNVSLRGSENVNILINGKPTTIDKTILLQQIPATSIDKIELITNPSAKYDPEGTSGIINIVLKEGAGTGTNGSITVNASTNNKYNLTTNLSYNPGKLTLNASYSVRDDKRVASGWIKRTYFYDNSQHNTESNDVRNSLSQMARLSVDYNFSSSFSAGVGASYNGGKVSADEKIQYTDKFVNYENNWLRISTEEEQMNRFEITANAIKKFSNNGHEWKWDYSFNNEKENEDNVYINKNVSDLSIFARELENNDSKNFRHILQTDYTWPINDQFKFELGAKSMFLTTQNSLNTWLYDFSDNNFIVDTNKTSTFFYDEYNHALYTTLSYSLNKFGVMAGLRYEYFYNSFHLLNKPNYKNTFPSLFPTMHTSYKFNEKAELSFSYSRRVNRPRSRMINPFPDYSDPQNQRVGNPKLKPEYINSFEMGFTTKISQFTIQPTIFYRYTDNMFSRYIKLDTVQRINIISFENSNRSTSYGSELNITFQPTKFWYINAGVSIYQIELNASNLNNITKQQFGYNGKIISNTMLPQGFAIQFSAFYRSPFITPQGNSDPFYAFNMGMRKDFFKGKLTGTLAFNDIFKTMYFGMRMQSDQQNGEIYRQFDSQFISAGLTYKFGKDKSTKKKRERENGSMDENIDVLSF